MQHKQQEEQDRSKDLSNPIIERALTALQQNNTNLAIEEITTLKNELADTYAVDEAEEEEKDDKGKKKD